MDTTTDVSPGTLRLARRGDSAELIALHHTALLTLARGHYSAEQIGSVIRHLPTLDPELIDDGTYFVIEVRQRIVACGGWSRRLPGYGEALGRTGREDALRPAIVRAMYTHPAWTRRGLGRRILQAAEAEAARTAAPLIELDALLPGVPLYLGAGYQPLGPRQLRLPDGAVLEVLHMAKTNRRQASRVP